LFTTANLSLKILSITKNKYIKKITTLVLSCTILLLTACDNKETKNTNEGTSGLSKDSTVNETVPSDESADGNGTYTAEGRTYTGKVTTATDGLKFFTVTCEGVWCSR